MAPKKFEASSQTEWEASKVVSSQLCTEGNFEILNRLSIISPCISPSRCNSSFHDAHRHTNTDTQADLLNRFLSVFLDPQLGKLRFKLITLCCASLLLDAMSMYLILGLPWASCSFGSGVNVGIDLSVNGMSMCAGCVFWAMQAKLTHQ